jgi:hypothetical protein
MSLSSYQRNEAWIPAPLGLATIVSSAQTLRRADRWELAAICLVALVGLAVTLVAAAAFAPAFDYGGILAAAG